MFALRRRALAALCLSLPALIAFPAHAESAKGKPLPVSAEAVTHVQVIKQRRAWFQRLMLEPYRRQPTAETKLVAFVEHACEHLAHAPGAPRKADLRKELSTLGALPTDALLQFLAGLIETNAGQQRDLFARAAEALPASNYPPFIAFLAAVERCAGVDPKKTAAAEMEELDRAATQRLREALAKAPWSAEDIYQLEWHLRSKAADEWVARRTPQLLEVLEKSPGTPRWLIDLTIGRRAIKDAWAARGGSFADKVTERGWEGFEEGLKQARKALTAAWEANPKHPMAAAFMITVVMGEERSEDTMRLWFDRAVAAQLDCDLAYSRLRNGLLPRWGGSHEAIMALGEECFAVERYDSLVPLQFVVGALQVARDLKDRGSAFLAEARIYDRAQEVLKRYSSREHAAVSPAYARTMAAVLAFKAGKLDEARAFLSELGNRPDRDGSIESWQNLREMMSQLQVRER